MAPRSNVHSAPVHAAIQQVKDLARVRRPLLDRRVVEDPVLAIGHHESRPAVDIFKEAVSVTDDLVPQENPFCGVRVQRFSFALEPPYTLLIAHFVVGALLAHFAPPASRWSCRG